MPGSISIRRAIAADIPALVGLIGEYWAFEDIGGFDADRTSRVLAMFFADEALGAAWIAVDDEGPAGYLLGCCVFSVEHAGLTAEIDEFFLRERIRGQGVGRRLLETAEAEFARRGCTNVALEIGRGNDDARAFYRRCGYDERSRYHNLDKALAPAGEPQGTP